MFPCCALNQHVTPPPSIKESKQVTASDHEKLNSGQHLLHDRLKRLYTSLLRGRLNQRGADWSRFHRSFGCCGSALGWGQISQQPSCPPSIIRVQSSPSVPPRPGASSSPRPEFLLPPEELTGKSHKSLQSK